MIGRLASFRAALTFDAFGRAPIEHCIRSITEAARRHRHFNDVRKVAREGSRVRSAFVTARWGTQPRVLGFLTRGAFVAGPSKSKKRQMSGDLESHYGAVRIKSVAGALEHHRNRDTSSRAATKSSKQKRSVLEGIGGRSQKSKGRVIK